MPRILLAAALLFVFSGAHAASVDRAAPEDRVSFELDVQPVLTAAGCNAGACHGKQRGQNGFQLSLFGFDSDFDHDAITRQARGRRIFPVAPEQSLLVQKATAAVPHGGGERLEPGSDEHELLVRWIRQGAPRRVEGETELVRVELSADELSLRPNEEGGLRVTAHYADGSARDVTNRSTYLSNDSAVVAVEEDGRLRAGELPGETAIMVRYMTQIATCQVLIPRDEPVSSEFYASLPRANFIDEAVWQKLESLSIRPSEPADDATFLRRAYTDIIGRLPSAEEAARFLDDDSEERRERLVEELLERPEYAEHWANQWADLLRPNPYRVGIKAVLNYDHWIRSQFRDNVPYDEFVRQLVTARGSTWRVGATTMFRDRRSPDELTTMVSQLFLGIRLECAKCHHHPFEKYSQEDFYSLAAYFAQFKHKGTGLSPPISGGEEVVFDADGGEVKHPVTDDVLAPRALFGAAPEPDESLSRREAFAQWLTSPENEYFARVQVNRVWAALMGRGIVDPVDDLRSTNPPTNERLLDELADDFAQSGFDLKHLIRTIATSHVYRLSSVPNDSNVADLVNYSRHYRHRLRAETLLDAIADVTEVDESFAAMPAGSRSVEVWTHRIGSMFLDTFGRPNENQDPPCERLPESSVTQTLHLMNSPELDRRIRNDSGRAARLASSDMTSGEIVDDLYLAIFSRRPSDEERAYAVGLLDDAGEQRRQRIEDLMWAMINAPEFVIQD